MKKFLIMLLAGITLCMSACQQTPENPVVISKNDGKLEESIYGTPAPLGKYSAPEKWEETIQNNTSILKIIVNADISVPDVEAFPVYKVNPVNITQEVADDFITRCIGSEKLYTYDNWRTKDIVMQDIIYNQELIDSLKIDDDYTQEDYELDKQQIENDIARLQEEYKNAPESLELVETTRDFVYKKSDAGMGTNREWYEIVGVTGDLKKQIYITKDYDMRGGYGKALNQSMVFNPRYKNGPFHLGGAITIQNRKYENLIGMDFSYDEAYNLATDMLYNKLGYTDYKFNRSGSIKHNPQRYEEAGLEKVKWDDSYVFIFTQEVDNIPVLFYGTNKHDAVGFGKKYSSELWTQEYISIVIDNEGIYRVSKISSLNLTEKITSNVALLPFDKIQDIFRSHILINADHNTMYEIDELSESNEYNDDPCEVQIKIDDIRLGYVTIREQNGLTTDGILVPVWMFFGLQTNKYANQSDYPLPLDEKMEVDINEDPANAFLCINAIDGSIIDLRNGY